MISENYDYKPGIYHTEKYKLIHYYSSKPGYELYNASTWFGAVNLAVSLIRNKGGKVDIYSENGNKVAYYSD